MKRNEEQAQYIANYLPSGKFWLAKNIAESDLRKLLNAFGKEFVNMEDTLDWLRRELNISTTHDLLPLWEKTYGIPDEKGIFATTAKSIEERITQIKLKEYMEGADRRGQWEYIARQFGYNVTVLPATQTAVIVDEPRYTIVVTFVDFRPAQTFTMYFPIYFSDIDVTLLKNIFEIIKPADCDIIYI